MTDAPLLNLRDWEAAARVRADPEAWEYLARGSGANVTRDDNVVPTGAGGFEAVRPRIPCVHRRFTRVGSGALDPRGWPSLPWPAELRTPERI